MLDKTRAGILICSLVATTLTASPAGAITEQNFRVTTTRDLVDLCSAPNSEALYTAAVNFCEGFMVGAYQYHTASVQAERRKPLVCPPTPGPTRSESIARFVQWGQSHPSALGTPPVEGVFEFLSQTYPCRG